MTSNGTRWIGPDDTLAVGTIGFLIEHSDELTAALEELGYPELV